MDQTPRIMKLEDENAALRQSLRDIANAEPIPTTRSAFEWCKLVAAEALNK